MAKPFERDRFTWLAYLLLAFYAYFLNVLGPIAPFLKDELGLTYTVASLHFTAFAAGMLLVGLGGHVVIARLGRGRALWLGALGVSAGAVLLVLGRSPEFTIGAAFVMGLVGSLLLAIIPSALSERHGEQRAVALSEANVVAALISIGAPLLVGWFAPTPGGWRLALVLSACAPLPLRLIFGRAGLAEAAAPSAVSASRRHVLPGIFWAYWLALALGVAVESGMLAWSAEFLVTGLGVTRAAAAQTVSLFLAGMILGRLAASRLVQRFDAPQLVLASLVVAAAGFLIYWTAASAELAAAGLFVTGLGVASLYPLILSLAMAAAGPNSVEASARATLASGLAILALPFVLGGLADVAGIRSAYGVILVLLAGAFLLVFATTRYRVRQPSAAQG